MTASLLHSLNLADTAVGCLLLALVVYRSLMNLHEVRHGDLWVSLTVRNRLGNLSLTRFYLGIAALVISIILAATLHSIVAFAVIASICSRLAQMWYVANKLPHHPFIPGGI